LADSLKCVQDMRHFENVVSIVLEGIFMREIKLVFPLA